MPATYILAFFKNARGNWTSKVLDTNIGYDLQGADVPAQLANLQQLAAAMQSGVGEVTAQIAQRMIVPPGVTPARATQTLFSEANSLQLEEEVIFTTEEGASILDEWWRPGQSSWKRSVFDGPTTHHGSGYSVNATTGSVRAALRAGSRHAVTATSSSTPATPPITRGSIAPIS